MRATDTCGRPGLQSHRNPSLENDYVTNGHRTLARLSLNSVIGQDYPLTQGSDIGYIPQHRNQTRLSLNTGVRQPLTTRSDRPSLSNTV